MNNISIQKEGYEVLRSVVLLFVFVLAVEATWILAAESFRPSLPKFPINAQAAAAGERNNATLAAAFGFIRGDLWAECALTYLDLLRSQDQNTANKNESQTARQARNIADKALAFAPHDSRIWLVVAGLDMRFDQSNQIVAAAALRMSYYTGPNETEIIPFRLLLAARSEALADKDFQQLVRHDIRIIVTRKPEMKSAILSAYTQALPIGQKFFKEALEELDPSLLTSVQPQGSH